MTTTTYKTDFFAWTQEQANRLRHEDYADLDLDNLIEELEDMGRSEQRELENRLAILLQHLLKFNCLPNSNPARGWRLTIREQRRQIARHLRKNPSLRPLLPEAVSDLYPDACAGASDDLAFDQQDNIVLPVRCPWTVEQMLDMDWLPSLPL